MPTPPIMAATFPVRFSNGAANGSDSPALCVALPVLAGPVDEALFPAGPTSRPLGAFTLRQSDQWLLGCAAQSIGRDGIESVTRALYDDLLRAVRGQHLCRIWNYVPHINAHPAGEENYRAFCRARSLAFESEYRLSRFARMCAASAVGTPDDRLSIFFAASSAEPRHYENPAQVPAYRYPAEHGPRSPSFARATGTADGRMVFISGTSSIKGHSSVAPGETAAQVACTLDNLALISAVAGLGTDLGAAAGWNRHFKVYLRHAADFPAVSARLNAAFFRPGDEVIWLQADICRPELNVEIEATLIAK